MVNTQRYLKPPGSIIPAASGCVLHMQLNELEEHELISSFVYPQVPPKVEYALTPFGESLIPVIAVFGNWGDVNEERLWWVIGKSNNIVSDL